MYNVKMFILQFPDGQEEIYPSFDWRPTPGDIYTNPQGEYEVESVNWLSNDSCTAIMVLHENK